MSSSPAPCGLPRSKDLKISPFTETLDFLFPIPNLFPFQFLPSGPTSFSGVPSVLHQYNAIALCGCLQVRQTRMKQNPLKLFVSLRQQFMRRREELKRELAEIEAALGETPIPATGPMPAAFTAMGGHASGGKPGKRKIKRRQRRRVQLRW